MIGHRIPLCGYMRSIRDTLQRMHTSEESVQISTNTSTKTGVGLGNIIISVLTHTVGSSYGYSSVKPCNWTSALILEHKHLLHIYTVPLPGQSLACKVLSK